MRHRPPPALAASGSTVYRATVATSARTFLPRPFRHRQYLIIWTGAFVSNIGTWMESVAVGTLVATVTGQAGLTGLVAALFYLPTVVVGPFAGAVADRFDRRRYLAVTTLAQIALATALTTAAATGVLGVPLLALLAFLTGCATAAMLPAWAAMLPDLVPPEDVLAATSLSQAQFNLGRVIGPALAGVVIAVAGIPWAFALNALSFAAVLVSLALVRIPPPSRPLVGEPVLRSLQVGFSFARRDPGVRTALLLLGATALLVSPFIGLVPAVAVNLFAAGATGSAALVTAQGVGAVLAAFVISALASRFGSRKVLLAALTLVGPAAVLYGLAPVFPLAVAAILLLGFVYLGVLSGTSTVCQLRAPRELRARVASLFMLVLGGLYPVGLVVHGWLGDRVGLRLITVAGGLLLLAVAVATRTLAPGATAALDPTVDPAVPGRDGSTAPGPGPSIPDRATSAEVAPRVRVPGGTDPGGTADRSEAERGGPQRLDKTAGTG